MLSRGHAVADGRITAVDRPVQRGQPAPAEAT